MQEISAKLVLTQEDIGYIWNGGTLVVKIDATDTQVSLDVSSSRSGAGRRQRVRIKRIEPQRQSA